jgi:hypothetical protein
LLDQHRPRQTNVLDRFRIGDFLANDRFTLPKYVVRHDKPARPLSHAQSGYILQKKLAIFLALAAQLSQNPGRQVK